MPVPLLRYSFPGVVYIMCAPRLCSKVSILIKHVYFTFRSNENVHDIRYDESRFSHSASSVHSRDSASKCSHRNYLRADGVHLPTPSGATSRESNYKPKGVESGYASPVIMRESNRLAPPPSLATSASVRYVHHKESRCSLSITPSVTDIPALRPLPPLKPNDHKNTLKRQLSTEGSVTLQSGTGHVTKNEDDDAYTYKYLDDDVFKEPELHRETTYLVSRANSVNDVEVVHWPPRQEETNTSSNNNCPWDDDESEVSLSLGSTYIDINLWSNSPIDGVDGELE